MSIAVGDFESIAEVDLEELIENQVAEGIVVDYKRDAYGRSDDDKREFLKDISSFANTIGGHIVVGMDEVEGLPSGLVGLEGDLDAEMQRLENLLRDCLEPRIVGLRMRAISLAIDRRVLLVRVPKSWNPPHAVTFRGTRRFFARNSGGVHEASVEELRAMFTAHATLSNRINEFHRDRVKIIHGGLTPIVLREPGQMVLHIVPFSAFSGANSIDPRRVASQILAPIWHNGFNPGYNFDGFVTTCEGDGRSGYVQVFRNGIIESAAGGICATSPRGSLLYAQEVEDQVVTKLDSYMNALMATETSPPLIALLAGLRIHGTIVIGNPVGRMPSAAPFPRPEMFFPPVTFENYGRLEEYRLALRPIFDALWNAAGYAGSQSYGPDGQWIRRT
jgi:hypothetical protein